MIGCAHWGSGGAGDRAEEEAGAAGRAAKLLESFTAGFLPALPYTQQLHSDNNHCSSASSSPPPVSRRPPWKGAGNQQRRWCPKDKNGVNLRRRKQQRRTRRAARAETEKKGHKHIVRCFTHVVPVTGASFKTGNEVTLPHLASRSSQLPLSPTEAAGERNADDDATAPFHGANKQKKNRRKAWKNMRRGAVTPLASASAFS